MTTALYALSVALGLGSLALFIVAIRRLLARQADVVTVMLRRYDERLAGFAQTLNDAVTSFRSASPELAYGGDEADLGDGYRSITRTLELARDRTNAEAAIAIVATSQRPSILATVGVSEDEAAHVGRMGFPDYRGARALQVSFNGEAKPPPGTGPIHSALIVSLLGDEGPPSMLAVFTRTPERRFSDNDIRGLEEVAKDGRKAIDRALSLREPDPVPELDPLTRLYDRKSMHALLDREIARARSARVPLSLLVADVDRLTTINARIGHLAADTALAEIGDRLRGAAAVDGGLACRIGGGRYAVLLPGSDAHAAERVFERLRVALTERVVGEAGIASVSGGVAELLPTDEVSTLLARADGALGLAKTAGGDTVASAALR
ncbi:MAG: GGDEF domain-containing protein [Gaiellaceae bacterium]